MRKQNEITATRTREFALIIYLLLTISTLACFLQTKNFNFINLDDDVYVYGNQHVLNGLTWDGVVWAFTSGQTSYWHPLTWLSLMLDCQLFGPNAGPMHLVNVFLHLLSTLLLFAVLKKMTGAVWPSAFAAAAFAIHPMHVESVAWITERKDVLSAFFWMLTLLAYVNYVRYPNVLRYVATLGAFAAGLLAKPMLVTLPFMLVLLDYWPLDRFSSRSTKPADRRAGPGRIIAEKIPFLALAVISSVITFLVTQGIGGIADTESISIRERAANIFLSYARYLGKMFWPRNMGLIYPFDAGKFTMMQIALCAMLFIVITVFVLRMGRKRRYLPVGWFWFVGALVPVIGFISIGTQALADRFTYIPYIGLFIMIAWGSAELLSALPHKQFILGSAMAIVLTALGIITHRQVSYWNNAITFFSHSVEVIPDNYIGRYNLANELRRQGDLPPAIENYAKAIRIKPKWANAVVCLGLTQADYGDIPGAIESFQEALRLRPDSAFVHNSLGRAFMQANRFDEAIAHFRHAVELSPDWDVPMNSLALLIAAAPNIKNRDANEAVYLADRACRLTDYKNPGYVSTLAAAYAGAGRFDEAVETAKKAINLAEAAKEPQLANIIRRHLALYAQGKRYTETSQSH